MTKIARSRDKSWGIQNNYNGQPHGKIQWNGTEVCMDINCKCGTLSHVDAEHLYYVACPNCKTVYLCSGYIELVEITEEIPTDVQIGEE